ncbi:hypothetical protein D3C71_1726820 [compost metagenome]
MPITSPSMPDLAKASGTSRSGSIPLRMLRMVFFGSASSFSRISCSASFGRRSGNRSMDMSTSGLPVLRCTCRKNWLQRRAIGPERPKWVKIISPRWAMSFLPFSFQTVSMTSRSDKP